MISKQPSDHSILWFCVLWPLSSLEGTSIIFFITVVFVYIYNHFFIITPQSAWLIGAHNYDKNSNQE